MPVPQLLSVSVVIPLDSVTRLPLLFAGLPPVGEIIIVVGPDGDTVLPLPRAARVIRQTRHGVGNAIACGVAAATGSVIVTLPGDGSCDPAGLPRLVEALGTTADQVTGEGADMAEGVREANRADLFLLWFMNVLLGCRPAAAATGFRAFRRDRAARLGLPPVAGTDPARGDGRDVETLLTARSRTAGLRVAEVPVAFYPQRDGFALLAGLSAIVRERLAQRHATRSSAGESIVILTGGSSRPVTAPPHAGPSPAASAPRAPGPVNVPRQPGADHRPTDPALRRWPAPNRAAATNLDHPDSAGIAMADRRRGSERRGPDRRRTDTTPDRRAAGGRPGNDRPAAESVNRRRWRDGQADLNIGRRPDLRVINGEGSGSGGRRGHLRSV
jgi:hypothetical protein